jgi:hypothetical protein
MGLEKVKGFLDWLERAKLLYDLFAAVVEWKLAKVALTHLTHIPPDVASAIAWGGAALLLIALHRFAYRRVNAPQAQSSVGLVANNVKETLSPGVDIDQFFRNAYRSPEMEKEVRKNMRILADQKNPTDHESFYLEIISTGLLAALYDSVWYPMFRSQLLALQAVNKAGILPVAKVRVFYDQAAHDYPKTYANDSFERWLGYLIRNVLVVLHPSEMVEITTRGKDFLKYLTHWGKEEKDKRL